MSMKGYSTSPESLRLEPRHQMVSVISRALVRRGRASSAEMQSVYSTGGARGVMVIVIGNGNGDTSSNPGRD